jgi:hypothetical protein
MIWFRDPPAALASVLEIRHTPYARMQQALESVASRAPNLSGSVLVDALVETGWVDQTTALRLLPQFRHFDPERHFAAHLRSLSFRGQSRLTEFRAAIEVAVQDLFGNGALAPVGKDEAVCFGLGEREGVVLAFPEVGFSIGGRVRDAILAAAEVMPDTLVVVARNFDPHAAGQLAGLLAGRDVPGTLVTVNQLLGIRAITLKYQPERDRVFDLLSLDRPLRSADIAVLGERLLHV